MTLPTERCGLQSLLAKDRSYRTVCLGSKPTPEMIDQFVDDSTHVNKVRNQIEELTQKPGYFERIVTSIKSGRSPISVYKQIIVLEDFAKGPAIQPVLAEWYEFVGDFACYSHYYDTGALLLKLACKKHNDISSIKYPSSEPNKFLDDLAFLIEPNDFYQCVAGKTHSFSSTFLSQLKNFISKYSVQNGNFHKDGEKQEIGIEFVYDLDNLLFPIDKQLDSERVISVRGNPTEMRLFLNLNILALEAYRLRKRDGFDWTKALANVNETVSLIEKSVTNPKYQGHHVVKNIKKEIDAFSSRKNLQKKSSETAVSDRQANIPVKDQLEDININRHYDDLCGLIQYCSQQPSDFEVLSADKNLCFSSNNQGFCFEDILKKYSDSLSDENCLLKFSQIADIAKKEGMHILESKIYFAAADRLSKVFAKKMWKQNDNIYLQRWENHFQDIMRLFDNAIEAQICGLEPRIQEKAPKYLNIDFVKPEEKDLRNRAICKSDSLSAINEMIADSFIAYGQFLNQHAVEVRHMNKKQGIHIEDYNKLFAAAIGALKHTKQQVTSEKFTPKIEYLQSIMQKQDNNSKLWQIIKKTFWS